MTNITTDYIERVRIEKCVELVKDEKPIALRYIASALQLHPSTCHRFCGRLMRAGLLGKMGKGEYFLNINQKITTKMKIFLPALDTIPNVIYVQHNGSEFQFFWCKTVEGTDHIELFGEFSKAMGRVEREVTILPCDERRKESKWKVLLNKLLLWKDRKFSKT